MTAIAVVAVVSLVASSCILNGAWATTSPAPVANAAPGADRWLVDVSCPTTTFCMAVGNSRVGVEFAAPFIQTWNGTSWTELPFHPWQLDYFDTNDVEMREVSCGSSTSCAVHWSWDYDDNNASKWSQWDGTTFVESPIHGLGLEAVHSPGSCAPDGFCMYTEDEGDVYTWDGHAFTHRGKTPGWWNPNLAGWGFYVLSCTSAQNCIGLGIDEQNFRWNGSSWEHLPSVPTPVPGYATEQWQSLSCTPGGRCVAVGYRYPSVFPLAKTPLAMVWDGTSWSEPPLPMSGPGELRSVSCADAASCLAVGTTTTGTPGVAREVALAWNGLSWYPAKTPPLPLGGAYDGVGCAPGLRRCMAVGRAAPSGPRVLLASSYAWAPLPPG